MHPFLTPDITENLLHCNSLGHPKDNSCDALHLPEKSYKLALYSSV